MKGWALRVHREGEAWQADEGGGWGRRVERTFLRGVEGEDGSSDQKCARKLGSLASVV